MPKFVDMTGKTLGRWTVMSYAGIDHTGQHLWECHCACGTIRIKSRYKLYERRSRSCGCLTREVARARFTKHGKHGTEEYGIYRAMVERCRNPNNDRYKDYGGRGIRVEWPSFEAFLADMGKRPSPKHSINRLNNDASYNAKNCRWATQREQLLNRRNNRRITYQGRTQTITEWAEEQHMPVVTLRARLERGWTLHDALYRSRQKRRPHSRLTYAGKTQTIAQWARDMGMWHGTLWHRLQNGWTLEKALNEPIKHRKDSRKKFNSYQLQFQFPISPTR